MGKPPIEIGDIFEIPLPDGRLAFGEFVCADKKKGGIIQVYDFFISKGEKVDLQQLVKKKLLFPPVFCRDICGY